MPSKRELAEVADTLDRLLALIAAGEVDAPPGLLAKLEDAAATVRALAEPDRPRRRSPNPS